MLFSWALSVYRWGFWASWGLNILLGISLVFTFSRGGFLALFAGLVCGIIAWLRSPPYSPRLDGPESLNSPNTPPNVVLDSQQTQPALRNHGKPLQRRLAQTEPSALAGKDRLQNGEPCERLGYCQAH